MKYLVSIIVPVFNTERYLKECLDSVIAQSYKQWELILIDDGSYDGSSVICDEYAMKDDRIRVFHKNNTGVSDSKNLALDNSSGEYIMFLDSDDFWCDDYVLEKLVNVADTYNLDIVRGEYKCVDEKSKALKKQFICKDREKYAEKIISSYDFLKYVIKGEYFLVLCLFRSSIIRDIRFQKGRIFLEDMQFLSLSLIKELRCLYLPLIQFYAYRKHGGSMSSRIDSQKINDSFELCDFFHDLAERTTDCYKRQYFHNQSIKIYYTTLETLSEYYNYKSCIECIKNNDLPAKRKNIHQWIVKYNLSKRNIVYCISPNLGVIYFKIRYFASRTKFFLFSLIGKNKT